REQPIRHTASRYRHGPTAVSRSRTKEPGSARSIRYQEPAHRRRQRRAPFRRPDSVFDGFPPSLIGHEQGKHNIRRSSWYKLLQFQNREAFMRTRMRLVIVLLLAIWTAGAIEAQITSNPIPAPIVKRGLAAEIKDLVRLP